jgi:hypothetical protein
VIGPRRVPIRGADTPEIWRAVRRAYAAEAAARKHARREAQLRRLLNVPPPREQPPNEQKEN